VLLFRDDMPDDVKEQTAEIRRLLRLSPDQQRLVLTYSPMRGAENELAVNSRSMLQVMGAFSTFLDAPDEHLKDGSAVPALEHAAAGRRPSNVRIHSGKAKPQDAFAAVQYRGYWFWVDNKDWQTKRTLTAIMFFFTLAEAGGGEKLPMITIPAQ
jgi:hypothetical protein